MALTWEATLNYACVFGAVKLTLFDDRKDSETKGIFQSYFFHQKTIH